jgi:cytochrome c-type biogenesis protein CcmH/NrfG
VSAGATAAVLAAFLVYLLQASVDWMWQSTAVTVLALAGVAAAAARLSRARPRLRWYGRVAVVLAAAGAVALQLPGLVSTAALRRSQAAERAGNGSLAYAWANTAVGAEPWGASAYEQRGLVLEAAGRLRAAAANLRRAVAQEPDNFAHWLLLARIETVRGDISAATRAYLRARQLRPKAQVFYVNAHPVRHGKLATGPKTARKVR